MKLQFLQILSWVSLVAYQVPLAYLLWKKLWRDTPVMIFSLYWTVGGLTNLFGNLPFISTSTYEYISVIHNLLDVPFVLYIIHQNTSVAKIRSATRMLIPFYIFAELIHGFITGFETESFDIMTGIGVFLIIFIVLFEVINYFGKMEHSDREKGLIFLFFAVLFEYSSYLFVYFLSVVRTSPDPVLALQAMHDGNIIYYISTLLGIFIACLGFMSGHFAPKPAKAVGPRPHEVLISIID